MSITRRILSIALLLLATLTVAFIFYNSMLPPEKSEQQSGAFGDIIAEIIPPETEAGGFVQKYLRKIAHFTEYGLLGIELMLFTVLFAKRKLLFGVCSLGCATLTALLDETIQIFSKRGPSVNDIWIDVGGYAFFAAVTLGVLLLIYFVIFIIRKIRD